MNVDRDFTKTSKGTRRGSLKNKDNIPITKKVQFNVLRAVMPNNKAMELAGINSNNTAQYISHDDTVSAIRERLQTKAGIGLEDQVNWYAGIRNDASHTPAERISAAKQIDTVLGYNAPQKVEINERRELMAAISVVSKIGMNPMELRNLVRNRKEIMTSEVK